MNIYDTGAFQNYKNTNPLLSLQEGVGRHIDQNALLEQALSDNRITEDQYKRMGGYNVRENAPSYGPIQASPGDVGLASFLYNTKKALHDPEGRGYGDIGYWDSIRKNYQGAKEGLQGDELELYSSITNPRSAFQDDYNYSPRETMASNWSELDDVETQDIDRERMEDLMRLASMEQYPTETEDEEGNWLANLLSPQSMGRTALSYLGNKAGLGMGLGMLTGPLGWAGAGLAGLGNRLRGGVSQNAFEQARDARRIQSRIDYMKQRREDDKGYSKTNLANLLKQLGQKDDWSPKPKPAPRPYSPPARPHGGNGGGNQGGGGGQAAADAAGGSSYSSPFNRGGLAALWQR